MEATPLRTHWSHPFVKLIETYVSNIKILIIATTMNGSYWILPDSG